MTRIPALLLVLSALLALAACSKSPAVTEDEGTTLVYGSGDYTRINPAMDEHGEINVLLFSGLTAHNGSNEVVSGLAESWEYDESACTYTFHLRDGVKWHDGEPFTAEDVKFTIEAIMDPENGRISWRAGTPGSPSCWSKTRIITSVRRRSTASSSRSSRTTMHRLCS